MPSRSKVAWALTRARRQIWFRAAAISLFAVLVAATAGTFARHVPYEFTGNIGQDSVGTVLNIIASSMLAVTTFSLTAMVSAYGSATQLATPRATQLLVSDPTSQNALSTFLGAFIFAVVGIIGLQTHLYGGQGRTVLLIATVLLIVLVTVTLLHWIGHLAGFGRMSDVIDRVEKAACAAMGDFARAPHLGGRPPVPEPDDAGPLHADAIGYVTHVDVAALSRIAARGGLVVHVDAIPGTLVHDGRPLMRVTGALGADDRPALVEAFTIERHRSFDHDPRLGVIALAEIASRALSPATNDPGTAIEVLNALLRTFAVLPAQDHASNAELPPVHVRRPSIEEMLDDAFLPIIRDGASASEVAIRLLKTLRALEAALPHAEPALARLVDTLRRNVCERQDDPADVARFDRADAEGRRG